ncbi:mechanosensitive channel MscS [Staphylococcus piscifermentans]|uniref:Mechanosensitive ion channel MscS domain-containing protein n=1 Tax=Staphylococcus piscifermentans TaxID=70258 RepID=A0A239TFG7_9STAP|nr:mechanosensitive ion channel domain-containing protein [Staphylococcus piscifermentans]RTX85148.1 mechanosensitive ion channel [Staphylococcus piscifermentans]GEP83625.1 hypothetical protein SPI02_02100 [Staphylococcus piscifermentans]SNU96366.1 mechanosensitive channel MscS [Staphylococcus piscifermentans]
MDEQIKHFIHSLFKNIESSFNDPSNLSHKVIFTVLIILISIWIHLIIQRFLKKYASDLKIYRFLRKSIKNSIIVIAIILLSATWINAMNSLMVIVLLFAALVVFSVKKLAVELVAWVLLLNKRLFRLYDRVEIDGHIGDVIKISPLHFKLAERAAGLSTESPTGKVINIPNHVLLEKSLINYANLTQINWHEVNYHLTVDSDWQSAKRVCDKVLADYVEEFKGNYSVEKLSEIEAEISLFKGSLEAKTKLLVENDMIVISCYFPAYYSDGSTVKSDLNEKILPYLTRDNNIELIGEKIRLDILEWPKEK